jgi:hypothetical protein
MLEIGQFKTVAPNISFDGIIKENTMLKKQKSDLVFTLVVTAGFAILFGYLYYQSTKKEIRILFPENNNLKKK